jgi:hypothetical protein
MPPRSQANALSPSNSIIATGTRFPSRKRQIFKEKRAEFALQNTKEGRSVQGCTIAFIDRGRIAECRCTDLDQDEDQVLVRGEVGLSGPEPVN